MALVGHLQSNKARKAVVPFTWIHSVDSLDLLRKLDVAAWDAALKAGAGRRPAEPKHGQPLCLCG